MTSSRTSAAISRIEAALARIEAAAPAGMAGDPQLSLRYQDLRQATEAAIAELDAMIAERR